MTQKKKTKKERRDISFDLHIQPIITSLTHILIVYTHLLNILLYGIELSHQYLLCIVLRKFWINIVNAGFRNLCAISKTYCLSCNVFFSLLPWYLIGEYFTLMQTPVSLFLTDMLSLRTFKSHILNDEFFVFIRN